ncbi:hypothetical protein AURDEDRAFT_114128 [Auricularia subglabra TFB-10046 SS5]|nr:hypothetical protein AURDEDRAFT_114128 [Auricularia subglabra TFB-10046 SS5]
MSPIELALSISVLVAIVVAILVIVNLVFVRKSRKLLAFQIIAFVGFGVCLATPWLSSIVDAGHLGRQHAIIQRISIASALLAVALLCRMTDFPIRSDLRTVAQGLDSYFSEFVLPVATPKSKATRRVRTRAIAFIPWPFTPLTGLLYIVVAFFIYRAAKLPNSALDLTAPAALLSILDAVSWSRLTFHDFILLYNEPAQRLLVDVPNVNVWTLVAVAILIPVVEPHISGWAHEVANKWKQFVQLVIDESIDSRNRAREKQVRQRAAEELYVRFSLCELGGLDESWWAIRNKPTKYTTAKDPPSDAAEGAAEADGARPKNTRDTTPLDSNNDLETDYSSYESDSLSTPRPEGVDIVEAHLSTKEESSESIESGTAADDQVAQHGDLALAAEPAHAAPLGYPAVAAASATLKEEASTSDVEPAEPALVEEEQVQGQHVFAHNPDSAHVHEPDEVNDATARLSKQEAPSAAADSVIPADPRDDDAMIGGAQTPDGIADAEAHLSKQEAPPVATEPGVPAPDLIDQLDASPQAVKDDASANAEFRGDQTPDDIDDEEAHLSKKEASPVTTEPGISAPAPDPIDEHDASPQAEEEDAAANEELEDDDELDGIERAEAVPEVDELPPPGAKADEKQAIDEVSADELPVPPVAPAAAARAIVDDRRPAGVDQMLDGEAALDSPVALADGDQTRDDAPADQTSSEPIALREDDAMGGADQRAVQEVDATTVPLPVESPSEDGERDADAQSAPAASDEDAERDAESAVQAAPAEPCEDGEVAPADADTEPVAGAEVAISQLAHVEPGEDDERVNVDANDAVAAHLPTELRSEDDERNADAHFAPAPSDDRAVELDDGTSGDQIPNEPIAPDGDAMNEAEQRVPPEVDATTVPLPVGPDSEDDECDASDEEGAELDAEAVDHSAHVEPGDDDEVAPACAEEPVDPAATDETEVVSQLAPAEPDEDDECADDDATPALVDAEPGGGGAEEPVALDGAYDTEASQPAHVEQGGDDEPVKVSADATSASAVALGGHAMDADGLLDSADVMMLREGAPAQSDADKDDAPIELDAEVDGTHAQVELDTGEETDGGASRLDPLERAGSVEVGNSRPSSPTVSSGYDTSPPVTPAHSRHASEPHVVFQGDGSSNVNGNGGGGGGGGGGGETPEKKKVTRRSGVRVKKRRGNRATAAAGVNAVAVDAAGPSAALANGVQDPRHAQPSRRAALAAPAVQHSPAPTAGPGPSTAASVHNSPPGPSAGQSRGRGHHATGPSAAPVNGVQSAGRGQPSPQAAPAAPASQHAPAPTAAPASPSPSATSVSHNPAASSPGHWRGGQRGQGRGRGHGRGQGQGRGRGRG